MRFSGVRLFPLTLMFALASLTFYLERAVRDEDRHPSLLRHDPDYTIENFTTTSYASDGSTQSIMSAAKMIHYPDDDSTQLIGPRMVQNKPSEPRLTVSAERGALSSEGDEIFLYDNVVLVREAAEGRPEARMTTSFLHVVHGRSIVRSDREVRFEEGSRSLAGRGMEYDNQSGELVLHANVRGRFEPPVPTPDLPIAPATTQ